MKRISRKESDILSELKDNGLNNKQIAAKLGISERTFYSYRAYFNGYRGNKNSRTPKPETIKKLKSLARQKRIRTTKEINENTVFEVYVKYKVSTETREGSKEYLTRDKLLHIPEFELETLSKNQLEKLLTREIIATYTQYGNFRTIVKIIYFKIRKEIAY